MESNNNNTLSLLIFNRIIYICSNSSHLLAILQKIYGAMEFQQHDRPFDLKYEITFNERADHQISILREGGSALKTSDIGEFIFLFEKDMTIELQKLRSDLLFIHSAALEYRNKGLLLVAPSGTGKSTTSWALLNNGFNYLSDELAPVDLNDRQIQPYPHALCLKSVPPVYPLPDDCLHTSQTIHVPIKLSTEHIPVSLSYIFYLEYIPKLDEPEIIKISSAEAAARIYANSLNLLAHDKSDNGLQSAISITTDVGNYSLRSNHLDKTCDAIKQLIKS